jgi:hypothetical protein
MLSKVQKLSLISILILALLVLASIYLPPGIDWRLTYRPAALAVMSGRSPYSIDSYFNAPWTIILLLPFALLPENIGRAALLIIGLGSYAFVIHKLGAKLPALIAFLISPIILHSLLNSNIDWLPLLGLIMPPQIGLLFLAIKPQMGIGVAFFWMIEAWRKGGFLECIRVFWPVVLALLISFVMFGPWPLLFNHTKAVTQDFNASLWPSSIPVGIVLLVAALHRRNIKYAMASSPCLSPYVLFHAWSGALASLASQPIEMIAAVAGLWILVIYRTFSGAL